jgi:hypothetical protein
VDIHPAYLAGLIDGDGTVTIEVTLQRKDNRFSFYPVLKLGLAKSEGWLLEKLVESFGGRIWVKNHYVEWALTNKKEIARILKSILPYLQLKRGRAELVLKCVEILDRVGERIPRAILKSEVEQIMNLVEEIRAETRDHRTRTVKWTKEKVMEIINNDYRYSDEYVEERRRFLMSIAKRGFKKGHTPWNKTPPEKVSQIIEAYRGGMRIREICEKFNMAETAFYRILRRNRVSKRGRPKAIPPWNRTPREKELKIIEAYNQSCPVNEILANFKISRGAFYKILRRNNVALRKR